MLLAYGKIRKVAQIIMESITSQKSGRQYKDTLFRTLFGDSKHFLELYNAVADEHFPDDTVVTPLPANELLVNFNDLATCIDNQLVVFYEHQSTFSNNMPLRLLSYASDILHLYVIDKDKLFRSEQVKIPTPKFFVLYNGMQKLSKYELKLSDAFIVPDTAPSLELTAKIIDININSGTAALTKSSSLQGYSQLIEKIRSNQQMGLTRDMAISKAMDSCIDEDILTEFLIEHYMEVNKMLNWEYDADVEKRVIAEEAREQGLKQGKKQGQLQGAELIAKLIKSGLSLDEALEKIKSDVQ